MITEKTGCEQHILEYLAEQAGCIFLSDLKYLPRGRVLQALEGVSAPAFPPREWADAAVYLTGRAQEYPGEEEAKAALLAFYGTAWG